MLPDTHPWHRIVTAHDGRVFDIVATRTLREAVRWGRHDVRSLTRSYGAPCSVRIWPSYDAMNAGRRASFVILSDGHVARLTLR